MKKQKAGFWNRFLLSVIGILLLGTASVFASGESQMPEKKASSGNLLDVNNVKMLHAYIRYDTEKGKSVLTNSVLENYTFVIAVEEGKTYTFSRKNSSSRLALGCGTDLWEDGRDHELLNGVFPSEHDFASITVPYGGKYLYVFFYREESDGSLRSTLEEAMITEGTGKTEYIPYESGSSRDMWDRREDIFGIEFDTEAESPLCTRIEDNAGLTSDAFDHIYPWCGMRICNVRFSEGKKVVVYEEDEGFQRDGSNGNVMVEIPAFYVSRVRDNTTERWLISGQPQKGFVLHPWFVSANGTKVPYRYYGAYKASSGQDGVFSASGRRPWYNEGCNSDFFPEMLEGTGFSRNTIFAYSALQYLFTIEYATRNSQSIFNGATYGPYFLKVDPSDYRSVLAVTDHELKLGKACGVSGNSFLYYKEGMEVFLGTDLKEGSIREITAIRSDQDFIYITVDGDPIVQQDGLICGAAARKTGETDSLTTPSGYAPGQDSHVASFRYRYIENPWGMIWEVLDRIKIKGGNYYLMYGNQPRSKALDTWTKLKYSAPMVSATDHDAFNWIKSLGMDEENQIIGLPEGLTTDPGSPRDMSTDSGQTVGRSLLLRGNFFYADAFYGGVDSRFTYIPAVGGAWDHHENSGLFCMRFLPEGVNLNMLYGERIIL